MIIRPFAALLLACTVSTARAEEDPPAPRDAPGETIVVTGLRLPRPARDVPAAVIVIDRAELARSPLVLADDLVRMLPSVGTFRRSSSLIADPTSQGLNLRGVGPSAVSRALVLRDGVPVNDPFGGWMYWRALSPLGIARVEATPSGASALFGDFALGGVVDIVSRPIEPARVEAVLAGGSLGTGRSAIRATDRRGDVGVAVDAEAFRTSGYAPITAAQRGPIDGKASSSHASAGTRIEHARAGSTTHVTARWFREALDAGTRFTTADVRTVTYGAGWKLVRDLGTLQVEVFGGDQLFEQTRARVMAERSAAALATRQRTPSDNQGALVTWTMRAGDRHTFVVGADARRVAGSATDALSPAIIEPDSLLSRTAGGEQRFLGTFVQDAVQLTPALELTGALRLDTWHNVDGYRNIVRASGEFTNTQFVSPSHLELSPRLGALVHASEHVALRASGYGAFRAPTLNELYRPFQVGTVLTEANPELGPETLWGAEAGPQIVVARVIVRATAFYNRLDDAIANVTLPMPLPSGAQRQRQNLGRARIAGLELDASWRPSRAWTVTVAQTFIDAEITDAPAQPELVGNRLPQDPRYRASGALTYDELRLATVTAQARYLGPMFEDDRMTLPIGAVVLVDARIARRLAFGIEAFAAVQNVFDRRYLVGRAGVDTEGAPRTFEIGLTFDSARARGR